MFIDKLNQNPATSVGSTLSAECLLAAEHLVLASWQYLSTVLPQAQRSDKPSTVTEEVQDLLVVHHMLDTQAVLGKPSRRVCCKRFV
jgi:hypothetical protein